MLLLLTRLALATTCANYAVPEPYVVEGLPVESSGIVASRVHPDVWYTHPDGGNDREIYSYDFESGLRGVHFAPGIANGDWEDIAAGKCPDGEPCLYIGDIGDNDLGRETISVALVREPEIADRDLDRVDVWEFTYPDGQHDAEAMVVHPCTGTVYIFTKSAVETRIYRAPADAGQGVTTLELVHGIDHASSGLDLEQGITGADWDRDGERLVVRTAARLWEWETDPAAPEAHWENLPRRVNDVDEVQGEAVGFSQEGAIVTGSEGTPLMGNILQCSGETPAAGECPFSPVYEQGCSGCATTTPAAGIVGLLVALAMVGMRRPTV